MEFIDGKKVSIHFDDVYEILDIYEQKRIPNCNIEIFKTHTFQKGDERWFGPNAKNFQECLHNSVFGNTKTYLENVLPMSEKINQHFDIVDNTNIVPVIKRKRVRKEFGDELDIQKIYQGKFDTAWQTTQRIEFDQEHHLVTILIDISHNAGTNALDSLWTAASCLKFVEALEKAGKQIQIIVGGATTKTNQANENLTATYTVKKYNQHLSVERLCSMTHLGFFRTACFIAYYTRNVTCHYSLGMATPFKNFLPVHIDKEVKEGKTKLVLLDRALNYNEAIKSVQLAQKQLIDNLGHKI